MSDLLIGRSAVISPDGLYRYRLDRHLGGDGPVVAGVMVNPSTADGKEDDATIRRWLGFGARMGASQIIIGNLFAYRATDVRVLADAVDPIGPDNDSFLEAIFREADIHIVGWGPLAKLPRQLRERWHHVASMAEDAEFSLQCWGTAQDGHPRHPLMLSYETPLIEWVSP